MICKLSEICNFQYGYPFNSKLFNEINGTPVIRIRDVKRGYTETFTSEYVPNEYLIKEGELLVGMDGEFNIAKWQSLPAALNQRVCHLVPNNTIVEKDYLFFALPNKLKEIENRTSFATVKHLSAKVLSNIEIPLPKLDEQCKIAKKLNIVVKIVKQRQQQLEQLDLLIKSRFVEMFGDPLINHKNWKIDALGNYIKTLTDFNANGSYELLDSNVIMYDEPNYAIMVRTTDLESGNFVSGVKYIDKIAYELLEKTKLFGKELIMNKIGSAGKIYLMPNINYPASLGRNAFMFRFDERINVKYLYFLLSSEYGTCEIQQHVRGAVTKTITKDSVRSIKIIVPPICLQNDFEKFVEQVEKSKTQVQKSLDEAQLLFNSLMQEYFG